MVAGTAVVFDLLGILSALFSFPIASMSLWLCYAFDTGPSLLSGVIYLLPAVNYSIARVSLISKYAGSSSARSLMTY